MTDHRTTTRSIAPEAEADVFAPICEAADRAVEDDAIAALFADLEAEAERLARPL